MVFRTTSEKFDLMWGKFGFDYGGGGGGGGAALIT